MTLSEAKITRFPVWPQHTTSSIDELNLLRLVRPPPAMTVDEQRLWFFKGLFNLAEVKVERLWEGAQTLGRGGSGLIGLWGKSIDGKTIEAKKAVRDVAKINRWHWTHPARLQWR